MTSDASLNGNGTASSPLSISTSNLTGDGIISVTNGSNSVVATSNVSLSISQAGKSSDG